MYSIDPADLRHQNLKRIIPRRRPAGLHDDDDDDDDVHALAKQSNYGKFVGVISVLIESQPGRR